MKKKVFVIFMICLMVAFCFACGSKSSTKDKDSSGSKSDTEQAQSGDSDSSDSTAKTDEGDSGDPANEDTTAATTENKTDAQASKMFIGTWKMKGLLDSDGSITDAGSCKYIINKDGSYTAKGTIDGKDIAESGTWTLGDKKKLVAGDQTLGINSDGYMLRYSGERNGKGYKLYYAFKKSK